MNPDVIIIGAGVIGTAIQEGTADPNDIKKRTRAGMGYCQGLNCFQTISGRTTM